ncbi:hypothetical protein [Halostella salina]|uniref:hypothetical protein n=1 Tax=Halostella salina TaxID=1547897 RepID=UPI0013CEB050|nr:hypothetical protein [Halostella salina]
MPDHQMKREIGLMDELEIQKALNLPAAYDAGPRAQRALKKELDWREQERKAALYTQQDQLRNSGFDNGLSVDLNDGLPDPVADPLPDPVVNHVDNVTFGDFRPKKIEPLPEEVITPDTSPLSSVPFVDYDSASPSSIDREENGISVKFEVSFDDSFDDEFRSEFKTK